MHIGQTPFIDKDKESFNNFFSTLVDKFKAEFFGGTNGEDGYFSLKKSIKHFEGDGYFEKDEDSPLECGTTSANKTHRYLFSNIESGKLARWPYDQKIIYLFKNLMRPQGDELF